MKKSPKLSQITKKPADTAKSKPSIWSAKKSAALRKPVAFPSGGDCACGK